MKDYLRDERILGSVVSPEVIRLNAPTRGEEKVRCRQSFFSPDHGTSEAPAVHKLGLQSNGVDIIVSNPPRMIACLIFTVDPRTERVSGSLIETT